MSSPPAKKLCEPNQPPRAPARLLPISEQWLPVVGGLVLCFGFLLCATVPIGLFIFEHPASRWLAIGEPAIALAIGVAVMVAGHALLNFGLRKPRRAANSSGFGVLPEHPDAGKS